MLSLSTKKGDNLDCNNYRPISLLSNISKIFEKSKHIHLVKFLRKNLKWILCFNHALTSLTDLIRKALDGDKFACGVFIDLQKAFNNVDHNILLSKLYHYGFFYYWDSIHARLNNHYEAWSYKKKEHKKIKAYQKSV